MGINVGGLLFKIKKIIGKITRALISVGAANWKQGQGIPGGKNRDRFD